MFLDETVLTLTRSGDLLLQVLRWLTGGDGIVLDIPPRQAARPLLNAPAGFLPIALLVLPPLLIAILAVAVLTPRRYL